MRLTKKLYDKMDALGVEKDVFIAFCEAYHIETPCEDDVEKCEGVFLGEYDSIEDYYRNITQECYNIPDNILCYIDFEEMARDDGGVVFEDRYAFVA